MAIVAAFAVPHPPLIIPAVGRGQERGIQATIDAYMEVGRRVAACAPDTLVISSPHSIMYRDYVHISPGAHARGSFARFGAPEAAYQCDYDREFVDGLCDAAEDAGLPAGTKGEQDPALDHATMIPLHFVWRAWPEGRPRPKVVRMGISGLSPAVHYRLGQCVQRVADALDRRVVYIASGDLSHKLTPDGPYGFAPEGPQFDERMQDIFLTGNFLELLAMDASLAERAAECGLRSFQIMAGALDRTAVSAELLSYEGPFGVGYGVAAFTPMSAVGADQERDFLEQYEDFHANRMADHKAREDLLVRLARLSIESHVRDGRRIDPHDPNDVAPLGGPLPAKLYKTRAGCFVSLKEDGELRGCIGTILPTRASLAEEICANAISAATRDPRFSAVQPSELSELVYDVDVLTTPEPIESMDELDVRRYGVIVSTCDGRRGLLLPDLDGVDSVEDQVGIAARKGGIDLDHDDWSLERFKVARHT